MKVKYHLGPPLLQFSEMREGEASTKIPPSTLIQVLTYQNDCLQLPDTTKRLFHFPFNTIMP